MFDLGKDLSRYIANGVGVEPRDPEVLELLAVDVLAEQARREARHADGARDPARAWRDVARLWLHHARRTGERTSARQALKAAEHGLRGRDRIEGARTCGLVLLGFWDLFGDELALREVTDMIATVGPGLLAARVALRRAARGDDIEAQRRAVETLHAALAAELARGAGRDPWRGVDLTEARLEHAAAMADLGLRLRDPRLLDHAGREVRALMTALDGDRTPISRARALAACGATLAALGEMAGRPHRVEEAVDMLEAAADLFTADHSPMDAAVLMAAQASALHRLNEGGSAEALKAPGALVLKARRLVPADTRLRAEIEVVANRLRIAAAVKAGSSRVLRSMQANLVAALTAAGSRCDPAAWAVDQLALAGVYEGLRALGAGPDRAADAAMARSLALETLREAGVAA